jgi:hypothetical protein
LSARFCVALRIKNLMYGGMGDVLLICQLAWVPAFFGVFAVVDVILLDAYQDRVPDGHYAVNFAGTLDECRAQTHHDGGFAPWWKADYTECYVEPKSLQDAAGTEYSGRIVELEPNAGVTLGVVLRTQPVAKPKRRRKKPSTARHRARRPE